MDEPASIRSDNEQASSLPNSYRTEEELEQLLLDGLNSGPAIEVTPEYWAETKRRLIAEYYERRSGK